MLRENVILPVPLQGKGPFECVEVGDSHIGRREEAIKGISKQGSEVPGLL